MSVGVLDKRTCCGRTLEVIVLVIDPWHLLGNACTGKKIEMHNRHSDSPDYIRRRPPEILSLFHLPRKTACMM